MRPTTAQVNALWRAVRHLPGVVAVVAEPGGFAVLSTNPAQIRNEITSQFCGMPVVVRASDRVIARPRAGADGDGYVTGDGRVTYALMAITAATTLAIFWGTLHIRRLV